MNKQTGDPTCSPSVMRAERIGKSILASAQAAILGINQGAGDENV